jgi:hypothetical protein
MIARRLLIAINNRLARRRRWRPEEILVLLPRCLQRTDCDRPVVTDIAACRRCGRCDIAAILALREEIGARFHMAGGGREAAAWARDPGVRVVVACACEKELLEGIRAAFTKPVLAVVNETPEGFCRNTRVDVARLRAALLTLLAP